MVRYDQETRHYPGWMYDPEQRDMTGKEGLAWRAPGVLTASE